MLILTAITSLVQHLATLKDSFFRYRPDKCPLCGKSGLWFHGVYYRKSDRENEDLNPIPIPRFLCPHCEHTCSVLPECIPPRRWYLWLAQQAALQLLLSGQSQRAIAATLTLGRRTIGRWWKRFKEQFLQHESVLRSHYPELGRTTGMIDFWTACLEKISLATAMQLCHINEVVVP